MPWTGYEATREIKFNEFQRDSFAFLCVLTSFLYKYVLGL